MSRNEIIAKAKRDYPPGTEFYPAHLYQTDWSCIVAENSNYIFESSIVTVKITTGKQWLPVVYEHPNRWAKIIKKGTSVYTENYEIW